MEEYYEGFKDACEGFPYDIAGYAGDLAKEKLYDTGYREGKYFLEDQEAQYDQTMEK